MTPSQIATIALILGISAVLLIATRRRVMRNQNSPRAYAREQINRIKEERRVSQQVEGVMTELEQLAREIHAQIDTRYGKLESVIRAADQRIDTLSRLVREADSQPAVDATARNDQAVANPLNNDSDGTRRLVHKLADAGYSTGQIAHQLGNTIGEVELILALRNDAQARA